MNQLQIKFSERIHILKLEQFQDTFCSMDLGVFLLIIFKNACLCSYDDLWFYYVGQEDFGVESWW